MAYGSLTSEYLKEKYSYEKYLQRSKLIRYLENIFMGMLALAITIMLMFQIVDFPIVPILRPEFTFNYIITWVVISFSIGGIIGFNIMVYKHKRIKKECSYDNIKLDFIHAYESLIFYDKFLSNNILVDKKDSIENLDKSLNIINKWDYGNISFIYNNYKAYIDFIQNEFKSVLVQMINSKDDNKITEVSILLHNFCEFLLYKNENLLRIFYDNAIQYKEIILEYEITFKEKMGMYIKNHQVISQLAFTSIFLYVVFYLGTKYGATKIELLFLYITIIGSSIPVLNWIKKSVFQIDK